MFNALIGLGILSACIYWALVDGTYFKIYLAVIAVYTLVTQFLLKDFKANHKRRQITICTWNGKPSD